MNYPKTVEQLLNWDTFIQRDSFGIFTVITGYEGMGRCFWCGKEIQGRRRFCGGKSGCWTQYQRHFSWSYASSWALRRSEYHCENCGKAAIDIEPIGGKYNERSGLEVHHIIPLNGADRSMNVYNIFWNLVCLCHDCHMELHAVMRPPKEPWDSWEDAIKAGQSIMAFELPDSDAQNQPTMKINRCKGG